MRFNLLGTLELVLDPGQRISIARPRLRQLLTVLLLTKNRPASSEFLVRAVWGEDQPSARLGTLRTHLHLLRRYPSVADRLRREVGGYVLEVRAGELDLDEFRGLAGQGELALKSGELQSAEQLFRRGLALWRQPELGDLPDTLAVMPEAARLAGERLNVAEQLIEVVLRQGRYRELVPELEVNVSADPLNERAWEQLMLALYGCGQRAAAIETYHRVRTVLVNQCGIDPGPRLQQLWQLILTDDPALDGSLPHSSALPTLAVTVASPGRG